MVVEDDPAIAELLSRTLGQKYAVSVCNDGAEALSRAVSIRPHLVLLDVNLPGMDGFSVAEAIKQSDALKSTPIIFLTARDHSMDVIRGINVGARHYVTKPFKLDDLMGKVERLLPA